MRDIKALTDEFATWVGETNAETAILRMPLVTSAACVVAQLPAGMPARPSHQATALKKVLDQLLSDVDDTGVDALRALFRISMDGPSGVRWDRANDALGRAARTNGHALRNSPMRMEWLSFVAECFAVYEASSSGSSAASEQARRRVEVDSVALALDPRRRGERPVFRSESGLEWPLGRPIPVEVMADALWQIMGPCRTYRVDLTSSRFFVRIHVDNDYVARVLTGPMMPAGAEDIPGERYRELYYFFNEAGVVDMEVTGQLAGRGWSEPSSNLWRWTPQTTDIDEIASVIVWLVDDVWKLDPVTEPLQPWLSVLPDATIVIERFWSVMRNGSGFWASLTLAVEQLLEDTERWGCTAGLVVPVGTETVCLNVEPVTSTFVDVDDLACPSRVTFGQVVPDIADLAAREGWRVLDTGLGRLSERLMLGRPETTASDVASLLRLTDLRGVDDLDVTTHPPLIDFRQVLLESLAALSDDVESGTD